MPDDAGAEVTELLQNWKQGDEKALDDLLPLVYNELRRLAHYHLKSERPDHTLQSTALVHEAYMRMMGQQPGQFQNRAHFIAVASRLMRQVLVDYARERRAGKRDGGCGLRSSLRKLCPLPAMPIS
jgi:RNA polymerase sigma factor (TIGR02999 family)